MSKSLVLSGFLMACGIAGAGFLIAQGLVESRSAEHFVTVKGVSERDVSADLAIWTLTLAATDNDLSTAEQSLATSRHQLDAFLAQYDFGKDAVEAKPIDVVDQLAREWAPEKIKNRYLLRQSVVVRTTRIDTVRTASQAITGLLKQGVGLVSNRENGGGPNPRYLFTGLNGIKPGMIADATAAARQAAEQFAKDSGSRIGGIRRANQGTFEILPLDNSGPEGAEIRKRVRVVSTLDYTLSD